MSRSPYSDISGRTDLGRAFLTHQTAYRRDAVYGLPSIEAGTLDVIALRCDRDPEIERLRNKLAALLTQPKHGDAAFRTEFLESYDQARTRACPLWAALLPEHHKLIGTSRDYTLDLYDPFELHALEEEVPSDPAVDYFVDKISRPTCSGWQVHRPEGLPAGVRDLFRSGRLPPAAGRRRGPDHGRAAA